MTAHANDVLEFWRAAGPERWFEKDDAFDAAIRLRFEPTHHAAARGECDGWTQTADGALALLVLLDQFPRNLYRGSAHSFATDPLARHYAAGAVEHGHDKRFDMPLRMFFYLPFTHSEALADQDRAVALCETAMAETGDEGNLKWAIVHRDVIVRFGRFPHRNHALGRATTPEEQAFLDGGGFAG
ncbi:MAG TPA: DUF924 family protein [Caulobacteraceae bacterium]|jgi:uncharacterized protein (DUF924 family)